MLHVQIFFWLIIDLLNFFWGGGEGGAVFVYILFSKLYILTRASLLALAKSIYINYTILGQFSFNF